MRVSCLRHGVTELNVRGVFSGIGEEGLTEDQRRDLGAIQFDASGFDAVYCSPAPRCKETARSLRLPQHIEEPRLAERHFGIFEGLTVEQCRQFHPAEFEAFQRLDANFAIPGGESRAQHLERVVEWLSEVSDYRHVLAVTHGGTIDFLYRLGTDVAVHGGDQLFAGPNAALSEFEVSWPAVSLLEHGVTLGP